MSLLISDKRNECNRLIENISKALPPLLTPILELESLAGQDFLAMLKLIRTNYTRIQPHLRCNFRLGDIERCIRIRNILYHQNATNIHTLNRCLSSLTMCQKAFGIQSALVPLRIMACKQCGTCITRTAQPTVSFKDAAGEVQKITRSYDVQVYTVGNGIGDTASRENSWYPGWVWTYTYCAGCLREGKRHCLGYRFDWAPEDRVNLDTCRIRYVNAKQAMVIEFPDGTVKDLTHVVSDGEVRRHRYALFESKLMEIHER